MTPQPSPPPLHVPRGQDPRTLAASAAPTGMAWLAGRGRRCCCPASPDSITLHVTSPRKSKFKSRSRGPPARAALSARRDAGPSSSRGPCTQEIPTASQLTSAGRQPHGDSARELSSAHRAPASPACHCSVPCPPHCVVSGAGACPRAPEPFLWPVEVSFAHKFALITKSGISFLNFSQSYTLLYTVLRDVPIPGTDFRGTTGTPCPHLQPCWRNETRMHHAIVHGWKLGGRAHTHTQLLLDAAHREGTALRSRTTESAL